MPSILNRRIDMEYFHLIMRPQETKAIDLEIFEPMVGEGLIGAIGSLERTFEKAVFLAKNFKKELKYRIWLGEIELTGHIEKPEDWKTKTLLEQLTEIRNQLIHTYCLSDDKFEEKEIEGVDGWL